MQGQKRYAIDVIDIALDVIDYLNDHAQYDRVCEIARNIKVNRARVYRILKTLENRGYVEYNPENEGYRLGIKFLHIGGNVRERLDLRREAEPLLVELARQTGDSAHLLIIQGDRAVTIDRCQGENRLQVASPLGQTLPLYVGTSPKTCWPTCLKPNACGSFARLNFNPSQKTRLPVQMNHGAVSK